MNELQNYDLGFCVLRLPKKLVTLMKSEEWQNNIFVGGGFIRSVIINEKINDIDIFAPSKMQAELLAHKLCDRKEHIHITENAYTLTNEKPTIQIIHKWNFDRPEDVIKSFDFTICSAVIWFDKIWKSATDTSYYSDLATKRLIYKTPIRIEEAGGSTLRVLKYYQKGFRIPIDSFAGVIARLISAIDLDKITEENKEKELKIEIIKLLRTVDPLVDPLHEAHLPNFKNDTEC